MRFNGIILIFIKKVIRKGAAYFIKKQSYINENVM